MLLPFDIADIHGALALAYRVIEIGWSDEYNANQQYNEFREDIQALIAILNNLASVIHHAQSAFPHSARPSTAASRGVSHVLGSFKGVLDECAVLVEQKASYGTRQGPIPNFQWFLLVKDDVQILRDRIAVCNIKLSLALRCLELERQDGTTQLLYGLADYLGQRMTELENVIRPGGQPERTLDMPDSIRSYLLATTTSRYGDLGGISVDQGIDETVFYLDRATQWHKRRQSPQASPVCRAARLYNLFRAYSLLQATKAAVPRATMDDFETYFPRLGMTIQRFLQKLGERILAAYDAFIREAGPLPSEAEILDIIEPESNIWEEHRHWKPRQQEDDDPRRGARVLKCRLQDFNAAQQSLEVFQHDSENSRQLTVITSGAHRADRVYQVDLGALQLAPNDDAFVAGSDRFTVTLNPVRYGQQPGFKLAFQNRGGLFMFQQFMTGYKVVDDFSGARVVTQRAGLVVGGEQRSETSRVQLWSSTAPSSGRAIPRELLGESTSTLRNLPSRSSAAPVLPLWDSFSTLTLSQGADTSPTTTTSPSSSTPSFDGQQAPFGSSFPRSQGSTTNRLSGGTRTGSGTTNSYWQAQINDNTGSNGLSPSSNSRPAATSGMSSRHPRPNEIPGNRASGRNWDTRPGATSPVSPTSPVRINGGFGGSRNSGSRWDQPAQRSPPLQQSPPIPPPLSVRLSRRASMAMSFMSHSSADSHSPSTMSSNLVQVDNRGTLGCIIDAPEPARLVLFLKGRTQFDPHSLLAIDIDNHLVINTDLCDCRQEDPVRNSAHYQTGRAPGSGQRSQRPPCNKVVIQARDGTSISAKETKVPSVAPNSSVVGIGARGGSSFWNLASAGRYQPDAEGLDKVKRLRLVTIEFGAGVEARRTFVEHFNNLRELYLRNASP
ncbi:hypothetical protein QBC44DRAFT_264691 [Cladorrhinum sp. PSN332]|nr:hypothetical protein QBC44DRAFT_264691 [Cladorrhinum sp. PSN332]